MAVRLTLASTQYMFRSTAFDYNAAYTICGWVIPRVTVTNNKCIVVVSGDGLNYDQIANIASGTPAVSISERRNGTLVSSDGTTALVVGTYTFCALVRPSAGGGVLQSYRGNTPATVALDRTADANAGTRALASNQVQFGNRVALDTFWMDGAYAGWRAYSSALTLAELKLEAASATPVKASPWAAWRLASASDLTDSSGNGRDLTAVNGPLTTEADPGTSIWPIINYALPTADVAAGSWTTDTGATTGLYAAVDELTTAVDTDYIQSSTTPAADRVKVTLGTAAGLDRTKTWTLVVRHKKTT